MKKFVSIMLALMMVLTLSAAALAEGADTKGTGVELTIYTNSGSSGRADWLRERAAQAFTDIARDEAETLVVDEFRAQFA